MSLNEHYKYIHCITSKKKLMEKKLFSLRVGKMTKPLVEFRVLKTN